MASPSTPPSTGADGPRPVLEAHDIRKRFPGVLALDGVGLRLFPGEVHALMGENGAGKSTLIKVLTGVHPADGGTIVVDGRPHAFADPLQAQQAGISTVYQEVNLCPNISVAENILIGREPRRFGLIHWSAMRQRAAELLTELDLDLDVTSLLDAHSLAVQQLVAIVRAVDVSAKVLVLDEPTSSLDREEVAQLFALVRRLRDRGVAILFVTHFLDQVFDLCDRVTILRNGRLEGEYPIGELTPVTLVQRMIGGELATLDELSGRAHEEAAERATSEPFLRARQLTRTGSIEPYDLDIHGGEVIGLAGLLGSGRTEAARLLFGADSADAGEVSIEGRKVLLRTPVTPSPGASRSAPRTASPRGWWASSRSARTSSSRCRPPVAGPGRWPGRNRTNWHGTGSKPWTSAPAIPKRRYATSAEATSRRSSSRAGC